MNLSDLIQFNDPQYMSGGAEGGTDVLRPQTIKTIAGIPVEQFIQRKGPDSMGPSGEVGPTGQVYNPLSGQWERGFVVPGLDNTQLIPESLASQIPGSGAYAGTTPKDVHDYTQGLQALSIVAGGVLGGGAITGALGGAGAAGAGLGGATTADLAGLTGASGAVGGGGTLASLAGGAADLGPMGLDSYAATGGVGAGTSWGAGAGAGAGGAAITDAGTGTFGAPGADATAAQATSGGTIGSGGYDATTAALGGAGAAGTGLTGSTAASGASALSKILAGNGSADDWASLLGKAAPGLLGAYGANQQAGQLSDLANQYMGFGAPSRARYEASMTPGFDPTTIPGYAGALDSTSKAVMAKLSATGGNPYGNPGDLIEANKAIVNGTALPAIQNYQNQNAASGGMSQLAGAVPGIAQQAIGSSGGVYSSLGAGINNAVNPPTTMADWIKMLTSSGISSGNNNPYGNSNSMSSLA